MCFVFVFSMISTGFAFLCANQKPFLPSFRFSGGRAELALFLHWIFNGVLCRFVDDSANHRTFGVTRAAMTLTGSNCVGQRRVYALVRPFSLSLPRAGLVSRVVIFWSAFPVSVQLNHNANSNYDHCSK
jgi:hypothetical protein